MAAHPDQVWVNDKPLSQVSSRSQVVAGTFFVDENSDRLIIGNDPSGASVVASTLVRAMTIQSPNTTVRGIGIRRYAPSIPDMGAVRLDNTAKGSSLRDVYITDMATTGLSVAAPNARISSVTSSNNGFLGVHSVYADGAAWSKMLIENNNTEEFNHAPAAGGFKITRARNVAVDASVVRNNKGNGLWFDESVYDISVTNSTVTGNDHHGISVELSEKAVIANNYIADNADAGLKLFDTGGAQVVNNTIVRNWMNVYFAQDKRRNSNVNDAGHDPRQPKPDPTVPWLVENISVLNNVIGDAQAGTGCILCVQDSTKVRTGAQMKITMKGNLFQRVAATGRTKGLITWPAGSSGTVNYLSLTDFVNATRQGDPGVDYVGGIDQNGLSPAAIVAQAAAEAAVVPAAISAKTGVKAGTVGANHK
jgi:parallel beta-helix repeat protein